METDELVKLAYEAREHSYSPYSHFRVGAALVTEEGKVYTGTNIENASYGATCCAERTAVFKAVSEGARKIRAIAICGDSPEYVYPCGICRQVLAEFGEPDMPVACCNTQGLYKVLTLSELIPNAFTKF